MLGDLSSFFSVFLAITRHISRKQTVLQHQINHLKTFVIPNESDCVTIIKKHLLIGCEMR
jgi:hypothetical protein